MENTTVQFRQYSDVWHNLTILDQPVKNWEKAIEIVRASGLSYVSLRQKVNGRTREWDNF